MVKIVFEDDGKIKVIRGVVISDGEFLIKIKAQDGIFFSIGKKFIISMSEENV